MERGQLKRMRRRLATAIFALPLMRRRWARGYKAQVTRGIPWTPLPKPLARCRVALVTTGGVHLRGDTPFDMSDPSGDPTWRVIPADTDVGELTITHDYYDHRDADRDINILFPLPLLLRLAAEGVIGSAAPNHYSLMGHIEGAQLELLKSRSAPEIAARIAADGADAVIFTPA